MAEVKLCDLQFAVLLWVIVLFASLLHACRTPNSVRKMCNVAHLVALFALVLALRLLVRLVAGPHHVTPFVGDKIVPQSLSSLPEASLMSLALVSIHLPPIFRGALHLWLVHFVCLQDQSSGLSCVCYAV